jgi:hypothetical protein
MVDNSRDIDKYIKLAERLDAPKKSKAQQWWEDRANRLYLLNGRQMVVIEVDPGHYQCWSRSIAEKCGFEWIYETKGSEDNG